MKIDYGKYIDKSVFWATRIYFSHFKLIAALLNVLSIYDHQKFWPIFHNTVNKYLFLVKILPQTALFHSKCDYFIFFPPQSRNKTSHTHVLADASLIFFLQTLKGELKFKAIIWYSSWHHKKAINRMKFVVCVRKTQATKYMHDIE